MEWQCEQAALAPIVARAVPRTPALPIMGSVLLKAEGETLTLAAGDGNGYLVRRCPAVVAAPGSLALPAKLLQALVARAEGTLQAVLRPRGMALHVQAGPVRAQLKGENADGYPRPRGASGAPLARVSSTLLAEAISAVRHAVAGNDLRPALEAVCLTVAGATLRALGCDTFRIAEYRAALDAPAAYPQELLLGRPYLDMLSAALRSAEEPIDLRLAADGGMLELRGATGSCLLTLPALTYPDLAPVFAKSGGHDCALLVARDALLDAATCTALVGDGGGDVVLTLQRDGLSERAFDTGEEG
jgi:DNA polymerase-3 subunit beta